MSAYQDSIEFKTYLAVLEREPKATFEYPGFISIPVEGGRFWAVGTVNKNWGGNLCKSDCDVSKEAWENFELENFPSTRQSDGRDIADAILEAIKKSNPESPQ